ncbi:MAG: transcription termination factor NusA [Planctomycetota bacterium]|nr:MAG: transcription termination factor NusA [Planctomycetota bacterium]
MSKGSSRSFDGRQITRVVEAIHRDRNIDKEIVFAGIEDAIFSAARKHFGEDHEISVHIDRETGDPTVTLDGEVLEPDVLGDILGRIAAQTARQVMIQKIREAEQNALYEEYSALRGQIVTGSVSRIDRGTVTVNLGKIEAILPRREQIPGESFRVGDRVRAIVIDVRRSRPRVRVILSRTHSDFVLRLFEVEIPEIAEGIIEIRSIAREAGYRSKVAVSCADSRIDPVGACVGVRGARIRNIIEELGGERIDIVRWNDSLQVLVPNAMQPAEVEDVILCPMQGRVLVLVREDQLSLAIGKRGQNVRLASKLVGWDIEVMTREELDEQLDKSFEAFAQIPGVSEDLAEALVSQGFFSYYDLSCIEPEDLMDLGGLTEEECQQIIEYADRLAEEQERLEEERRAERRREEAEARLAEQQAAAEAAGAVDASPAPAESESVGSAGDTAEAVESQAGQAAGAPADSTAAEDRPADSDAAVETAEPESADSTQAVAVAPEAPTAGSGDATSLRPETTAQGEASADDSIGKTDAEPAASEPPSSTAGSESPAAVAEAPGGQTEASATSDRPTDDGGAPDNSTSGSEGIQQPVASAAVSSQSTEAEPEGADGEDTKESEPS